jgi:hypothetical protein
METFFLVFMLVSNTAAIVLMLRLLGISDRYYTDRKTERRYFRYFIWSDIGMAVINTALQLLYPHRVRFETGSFRELSGADAAMVLIGHTLDLLNLFMTTVFLFLWLVYVSWRLYPGRDYARRRFWRSLAPLLFSGATVIISFIVILFVRDTGLISLISVFAFLIIRVIYFIVSVLRINLYNRQNGRIKFFSVRGFYIPVVLGTLIEDFTDFNVRALGAAIGITFLYASIVLEQRYQDSETGLYNSSYREYLEKLMQHRRFSPCSAMVFTAGDADSIKELSAVLKKKLPKDCEPIRHSDCEVVVLTQVREKAPLYLVTQEVQELTQVKADCVLKKKSETPAEFMERVL